MDIKLYFYNGFEEPKEIDINNVVIRSNYLGDVTELILEEYDWAIDNYSLNDLLVEQPLASFNIWFNPPKWILQDYNLSVGLPIDAYIASWEDSNNEY